MILVTSESLCTHFFKIMMSVHLEMSARTGCVWTRPGHSTVSAALRWFSTAHGDAALISTPQRVWHTHTQTDYIFSDNLFFLDIQRKSITWLADSWSYIFPILLFFLLNPSHCTSQKLWTQKMTCTWIFAGSNSRATTCVPNRSQIAELHTLSVAACMVLPGVDTVPSVPGKTLVRSRNHIR